MEHYRSMNTEKLGLVALGFVLLILLGLAVVVGLPWYWVKRHAVEPKPEQFPTPKNVEPVSKPIPISEGKG